MKFEVIFPNGKREIKTLLNAVAKGDGQIDQAIKWLAKEELHGKVPACGLTLTDGTYIGRITKFKQAGA